MKTEGMVLESDRRGNAEELEETLKQLPIEIKGFNIQLRARRGLGNIVYIRPSRGKFTSIQISGGVAIERKRNYYVVLNYGNQIFDISLNYGNQIFDISYS